MKTATITALAVPLTLAAGMTASLLLPGRSMAQEAEIILYDLDNFGGRSITFNESQPDLDPYNWDNDVESIRVVTGTWRIYRDDDYQEFNGPSFELIPGEYPDIAQNPGFPHDRMSSVQLVTAPEPEPEPVAGAQTPPPTLLPGSPCPAVLGVHWDVTSIAGATGVTWRLNDENGVQLDTGAWNATSDTETIDLRSYGPVLNGASYTVQVRALAGSQGAAGWSDPVPFSITTSSGSLDLTRTGGYDVQLDWSLGSSIAGCAEEIRYEVHDQAFTVADGDQPGRLTAGVLPSASGTTTIDLQPWHAGTRWIRLYATGAAGHDVGPRGGAESVSVPTMGQLHVSVRTMECGGRTLFASGATVSVDGPVQKSEQANENGVLMFHLPPGTYSLVATTSSGCTSETRIVSITTSAVDEDLQITGCESPVADADLAVEIRPAPGRMLEGEPLALAIEVTNEDDRGPAPEREVTLSRVSAKSTRSRTPTLQRDGTAKTRPIDRETVEAGLCPGESRTVMMSDASPTAGSWAYRAALSGTDADDRNDEATTKVTVRSSQPRVLRTVRPDLNPNVTQSHTELPPNATMTYTVEVANDGTGDASDVTVRSEISENLDFLSVNASHGFQCVPSGTIVTCESGDLSADETATITIRARLPSGANPGHSLVFGTEADPDDAIVESDENDNAAGAFAQTAEPPLVVHEMTAGNAMDVAKERGYTFVGRSDPITAGWCDIVIETFISRRWIKLFAAHPGERPPTCEYRLFQGGELSPGWSIAFEVAEHEGFLSSTHPTDWTDDPSFVVKVRSKGACGPKQNVPSCRELGARVTTVRLRGPEGQNWPAAFPQQ